MGDEVMLRVRDESFPHGTWNKLHAGRRGPYKVLQRIGLNAYELDIP